MVMAVAFSRYGRLYYLDPGPYSPRVGDKVLVPTDDGPEVAECIWATEYVTEDIGGLPVCAGFATETIVVSTRIMKKPMTRAQRAGHGLVGLWPVA